MLSGILEELRHAIATIGSYAIFVARLFAETPREREDVIGPRPAGREG